jgi:hypothetical protein
MSVRDFKSNIKTGVTLAKMGHKGSTMNIATLAILSVISIIFAFIYFIFGANFIAPVGTALKGVNTTNLSTGSATLLSYGDIGIVVGFIIGGLLLALMPTMTLIKKLGGQ